ncbi:hypothetical protein FLW53_23350 [Microbispora sp. SCL1-1]|uniref:hypothetical protein n=1 Tax=unclassified Microbispora TaxID=2614687 RepID=UPI00115BC343|nr:MULTISPECIES: hypothetical protein [unclassified Microbispora]NJP27081.1 hypothetical protein [Microbispora sp. CL1-1]TQS11427.1 hypothetical protein FLW53_23350 [Microbispora sp. SCL1-1]
MPITTVQGLHDAIRNALDGASVDAGVVCDALYDADMQIVPTVYDDRYWRLFVATEHELRVLDSEDLPRELALVLAANPGAAVVVRPADEEEAHAFMLLGEGGLRELDAKRHAEEAAIAEETAAALAAALGSVDD